MFKASLFRTNLQQKSASGAHSGRNSAGLTSQWLSD
jgi:hypothetical protein